MGIFIGRKLINRFIVNSCSISRIKIAHTAHSSVLLSISNKATRARSCILPFLPSATLNRSRGRKEGRKKRKKEGR